MCLLSAMTVISKTKAPEARDYIIGKQVKNGIFLKYHLLLPRKFSSSSLCHVTYVTYFNKCSDPDVKLANV